MAKFSENIQEFTSTVMFNKVPVTNVGDRWIIMNHKNAVVVKQVSRTVQTWLLMDGRSHSFTSPIVHFGDMLYSVMDHNVLIRWSIDDSSLRNPEKVEFQEAVFDILSVPDSEPLLIFKSGQLAVVDTQDFPNTKPINIKIRDQLDWADAASTEAGIRVFYKTHSETAKHITLYYFTIDEDKQRSSANYSYSIRPEKILFRCCALNHAEGSFLSLWSDGSIRCFDDEKEDQFLFSIGDLDKDTIVDLTCLDSRHIAIVKGKVFGQECSLEIWDIKKHLLEGRKMFKTHHHLQNLHISVLDSHIFIQFHSRILAIPFSIDTTFLASLNTDKADVHEEHAWNDDVELREMRVETEKIEASLLDDILSNSAEDAVEKLLNRDVSYFKFLPEYELVKILKLAINCKKNEKPQGCTREKLNTLLNRIFSTSFNDALLVKKLKTLSAEDTLVLIELLMSFLNETMPVPKDAETPTDLHIINWMYAVLSSKTESLIMKDDRAKMIFKELKKMVAEKMQEYEELESVQSYFSILLRDKNTLPEEHSAEKYSVDTLDL